MDSLTQIVLGAAVGEVTLGKKVGNRALLWGAVGGTIPDLDVIFGAFLTPLQELAAHRGFSHSILFALMGAFIFGWIIQFIYQSSLHKYVAFTGWFLIPAGVVYFFSRVFDGATLSNMSGLVLIIILIGAGFILYRRYFIKKLSPPKTTARDWQWLMFWAIFTHPLLDCFTTYGTQLFQPFSDYRVAFNVVAVADPIYTIPFLGCIIALGFYRRSNHKRRRLAWIGIVVSSLYLLVCCINKFNVNKVWTSTLDKNEIDYERYMTSPSIFNNILWSCVAETKDGYLYGQYSLLDTEPEVQYSFTPRDEYNLMLPKDDPTFKCLKWFSNGYYSLQKHPKGFQFNDMRFGTIPLEGGGEHYIFNFVLQEGKNGSLEMLDTNGGPPPGGEQEMLKTLWQRIKGI